MPEIDPPSRPPLVLLANDQEWFARSLESILGPNGYAVLRAYTGQQALDLARASQPDLVILDSRLPDMAGTDVCSRLLAERRLSPATPIVMTSSGPAERHQRIAALQAGAWEVLSQPIDSEILLLRLPAFLRGKREVDRLAAEGLLDQATGLYNMRGLVRRARELSAEAQRLHAPITCVALAPMIDGAGAEPSRPVEDSALVEVGEVVRRAGRVSDVVGRLGPGELAIIAPATGRDGAVAMIERLRGRVERESRPAIDAASIALRAGYCAAADFAESAVDAVEMLLRATAALRHACADARHPSITGFDELPITSGQ